MSFTRPTFSGYPPIGSLAVTPSDTQNILPANMPANAVTQLYVGGAGDVNIMWLDGTTTVRKSVPAGTTIYGHILRVMSSNTTATLMVADYC